MNILYRHFYAPANRRICRNGMRTCSIYAALSNYVGAVKFGDVLPWERDADITFLTSNFTALSNLAPIFGNAGYSLKMSEFLKY